MTSIALWKYERRSVELTDDAGGRVAAALSANYRADSCGYETADSRCLTGPCKCQQ